MLLGLLLFIRMVTVALIRVVESTGKLKVPFESVKAVEFAAFSDVRTTCDKIGSPKCKAMGMLVDVIAGVQLVNWSCHNANHIQLVYIHASPA